MSSGTSLAGLTCEIVIAHLENNRVAIGEVGILIQRVYSALAALGAPSEGAPKGKTLVVSIKASIKPDHLLCLECGAKQRTLKRHLRTAHASTPDQYRTDFGLPRTYPMTAPNYTEMRKAIAKRTGLGRKRTAVEPPPARRKLTIKF